jgi:hypothetical protein
MTPPPFPQQHLHCPILNGIFRHSQPIDHHFPHPTISQFSNPWHATGAHVCLVVQEGVTTEEYRISRRHQVSGHEVCSTIVIVNRSHWLGYITSFIYQRMNTICARGGYGVYGVWDTSGAPGQGRRDSVVVTVRNNSTCELDYRIQPAIEGGEGVQVLRSGSQSRDSKVIHPRSWHMSRPMPVPRWM